jgi:SWI/SNF-related matrix-associated actin-dependent regulator 1 of chromatin subfamily A
MGWDFSGHSNLRGLQNRLRATGMLRRLKSEVLKDLPPKRRQVIEIPKEGFERVLNREKEASKKFRKLIKDVSDESGYNQAILRMNEQNFPDIAEIAKIRHETAIKKAPKVIEFIEDLTSNTGKIVIMCHHKDVVNIFKEQYGESCVTFTGAESADKKYEAERKFREDPNVHYFVASIKAAGLGINLTVSDVIVFAELDWVPASITQSEDRLHRMGQQNSVMAYHVVLEKSIDCTLARRIVEKQQVIEQAINRREE